MRKLFLLSLFFVGAGFFLNAQTLATFENLEEDVLLFSDWGTSGDPYWFNHELFVEGGVPQVADNPSKSGINTSNKCLVATNVPDPNWWGNFAVLGMKEPVTIAENNRYLHFNVYRSIQPRNFRIFINGMDASESVFEGKVANDAQWESVVCDLGAQLMGDTLEYIRIVWSVNYGSPDPSWGTATYAYDDFALSNSSMPPSVYVGLNQQKAEDLALVFASENQINIQTDKVVQVELFDILGKSVQSSVYHGNAVIPAMKGVYIVKVTSDDIKQISKVLVK